MLALILFSADGHGWEDLASRSPVLWLATDGGLARLDAGGELSRVGLEARSGCEAVAAAGGRVWVVRGDRLAALEADGAPRFELPLERAPGGRALLAPRALDGSVWVATGMRLRAVGDGGADLAERELAEPVVAMALDAAADRLWVATSSSLLALDAVTGLEVARGEGRRLGGLRGLGIDARSGDVWASTAATLYRWTREGEPRVAVGVARPTALAADGAGGVWLATADGLEHRGASGERLAVVRPFSAGEIVALAAREDGRGVWAASRRELVELDAGGAVLRRVALPPGAEVLGLALPGGVSPRVAERRTVRLVAVADSYLKHGSPNQNQGGESLLRVRSSGSNRVLVGFEASEITAALAGTTLVSASLELFVQTNGGGWGDAMGTGRLVAAHRLTTAWSESGATWNCAEDATPANGQPDCAGPWAGGAFAPAPSGTVLHTNASAGWLSFDVTADLAGWTAGDTLHGWLLKKVEEGQSGLVEYASREVCGHEPRLVLVVDAPAADAEPPRLEIRSPSAPYLINPTAPPIELAFFDAGSAIAPGTLSVRLDGVELAASCTVCSSGAVCPASLLTEGPHTLAASIADVRGNVASTSLGFDVLLGDGEHRLTLPAVADSYLRSGSANQNQGAESLLRIRSSGKNRALARFDLSGAAPLVSTLHSATLELFVESNGANWGPTNSGTGGRTIDAHRLLAPWSESGATWNCADDSNPANSSPDCSPQWSGGSFAPSATASYLQTSALTGWVSLDVTADVAAALSAILTGQAHHGWLLKKTDEGQNGLVEYTSREGTAGRGPRLVLVFDGGEPIDSTPPTLAITAPTAGAIVESARPVITFTFADLGSGVDPASLAATANGAPLPLACTFNAGGAECEPFEPLADGPVVLAATVRDLAGNVSAPASVSFTIDTTPEPPLPPDPATVAPPLDATVASDIASAVEFLYTGASPIQTGVSPGTIEARRVAVLRGRVLDRAGAPLPGATVRVHGHAELGQTLSRADGAFDLAVNGGGVLTIEITKAGHLPAQRQVEVPWRDWVGLDDVVLVALDPNVTAIASGAAGVQTARGGAETDADGTRRATVIFPAGTGASLTLADGSTQALPSLTVRATEYTVGERGPEAMPGPLPPSVAYTYAVELSADEAIAAGAMRVDFTRPVYLYVENFLGFPTGTPVPLGSYDRERAAWIGASNGRVVKIVGVDGGGRAELALEASEAAAGAAELAALGFTDGERLELARLYTVGQSLWRSPIPHFTPWDCNFPWSPPEDAELPPDDELSQDEGRDEDNPCPEDGSVIGCENQSLGERLELSGTPFELVYQSDRTPGRSAAYTMPITLTGSTVPASLKRIELKISIAGRTFKHTFAPSPNRTFTFVWDGLDAYGRRVQGGEQLSTTKSFVYDMVYTSPSSTAISWGRFPAASLVPPPRRIAASEVTFQRTRRVSVNLDARGTLGTFDARALGLGGWTLDAHHVYDATARRLYLGNGRTVSASSLPPLSFGAAGTGEYGYAGDGGPAPTARISTAADVAYGPDGSLYIADLENSVIRRVSPQGLITTIAGDGIACEVPDPSEPDPCGENVPATAARLRFPAGVAVSASGEIFVGDTGNNCVRKIDPQGVITTIAGQCDGGLGDGPVKSAAVKGSGGPRLARREIGCDDCPGREAELRSPRDLALAPDGGLFIADFENDRIRYLSPGGEISTHAGGGLGSVPATGLELFRPVAIDLDAAGYLFVAEQEQPRVWRIGPDGSRVRVAGSGVPGTCEDGEPATGDCLGRPIDVEVAPDGGLLIADVGGLFELGLDGSWRRASRPVDPLAPADTADGGPPVGAGPLTFAPDGSLTMGQGARVFRFRPALPGFAFDDLLIPAAGGSAVYVFDARGRHLRTVDALTGVTLLEFLYDGRGLLSAVRDLDGLLTTIERDASGGATGIVGPFGQRSGLELDAQDVLTRFENPAAEATLFTSSASGLIQTMTDPRGSVRRYTYAGLGRLSRAADPVGGEKTLERTAQGRDGYFVELTSPLGRTMRYVTSRPANGDAIRTQIDPLGGARVTSTKRGSERSVVLPDGTTASVLSAPDPRWGLLAPVPSTLERRTPSGLTTSMVSSRGVTLADPTDPLSLATLVERVRINGRAFERSYDASTRELRQTSAEGRTRVTRLDAKGRPVEISTPGLAPVEITYDLQGRATSLAQGVGAERRELALGYDAQGWLATLTDPSGRVLTLTRDAAGRTTRMSLPGGRTVAVAYDGNGNATSVTPPGRPAHTFAYTPVDLGASYAPPPLAGGATPTSYAYDLDRQPTLVTRPNGETVSFTYEPNGRLASTATAEGTYGFTYVPRTNQLASATGPGGEGLFYTYDGSLVTAMSWSGSVAGSVARTYDADLRVSRERVNGAHELVFGFDDDGLLTSAGPATLTYHPGNGLLESASVGAVTTSWSRNAFGEPAGMSTAFGPTSLLEARYVRDALGRIVEKTETIGGATSVYRYSYSTAGRLETVERDGAVVASYTYDANGNRLTHDGSFGPASGGYDEQDRLVSYGAASYTFDANGDLVSKSVGGQSVSYDYDTLGALRQVTLPSGVVIDYVIDPRGRRVGKRINGTLVQGFLYRDALRLAAELDGTGAVRSRFVYASRANVPDSMVKDGTLYAFLTDHLGSPRLIVDTATGTIAQRLDYDEFGRVQLDTNPGFQPFGFAGGLYDPQTGLVRFGARDYDPETGRWTAKDPSLFDGRSGNLYSYAFNDPVNFTDEEGQAAVAVAAAGLVALTVAVVFYETWLATPQGQDWLDEVSRKDFPPLITPMVGPRDYPAAPGRRCPAPTAIPGARPKTTPPPPPVTDADPDDPRQPSPPEGPDKEKKGFWDKVADVVEGVGELIGDLF